MDVSLLSRVEAGGPVFIDWRGFYQKEANIDQNKVIRILTQPLLIYSLGMNG